MKVITLFIIILVSLSYPFLFSNAPSTHLINRRARTPQLFITIEELFAECDRNSEPVPSFLDPARQLPHGRWYYGQVGIGEIRELKGVKFNPPLDVVAKIKGGEEIHLICAILNEYWRARGEVTARNVPYILTPYQVMGEDMGYFYEYREGHETSPPDGTHEYNPWLGYESIGEKRNMPPFLAKLLEVGLNCYRDIVQSDDGRVGKHWIEGPNYNRETHEDGWLIDYEAIHTDAEKISRYLKEQEAEMREILGYKYELLRITFQLMQPVLNPSEEERIERQHLKNEFYRLFSRYQQEIWAKILAERGITPP